MSGLRRNVSHHHFQIVVTGSGFAGALMAMVAQRLGFSTALIERGHHPRFAIGESSTPLANLLLEEISDHYQLPLVRPLAKWGAWQRQVPQLACGLKRGFTFFQHEFGKPFAADASRHHQLLVGASTNEETADTHWYRSDFDHYLVNQARELGVTYWDETTLSNARESENGMVLAGTRLGKSLTITADFVIDASGPRGFLHQALGLAETAFEGYPQTQALFTHFESVRPLPVEFSNPCPPPYPPEQAAVHHLFPGGWVWVLKFNNGITSAGVAATDTLANHLEFKAGAIAWQRLLARLPSLSKIFDSAAPVAPFIHLSRLAFQSGTVTGTRWALLPSAAGFVDPLLSTGFPLTLLGIKRMAELLPSTLEGSDFQKGLEEYATLTKLELTTAAQLVAALYATLDRFELFKPLSLLYFAASSYSEAALRLGKPELAQGFLLCRHPVFSAQVRRFCELATQPGGEDTQKLAQSIRRAIEPFDVAGLTDQSRDPWYPAMASDLLRNTRKLGVTEHEMLAMLERCGLEPALAQGPSRTR